MARPRDLLKKQEISFDNHHEGIPEEWDDNLHLHKKMTVGGPKGVKADISCVIHVAKNRGIKATYHKGKSHPKIKNEAERRFYEEKIKKEISEAIEKNEDEARPFLRTVMSEIESISRGEERTEVKHRKQEAYDNIMDALGISPKLKVSLRNKNNDLMSFYVEAPSKEVALNGLLYLTTNYNRYYRYIETPDIEVYYIVANNDVITMGEFSPYALLKYKHQGYSITKMGFLDSLEETNRNKEG